MVALDPVAHRTANGKTLVMNSQRRRTDGRGERPTGPTSDTRRGLAAATCAWLICGFSGSTHAGHSVFHLFTPAVEAGHWGFEALSGVAIGLPGDHHDEADEGAHAHGAPRAAHEVALHVGFTSYWQTKLAIGFEREDHDDYRTTYLASENVIRFAPPRESPLDFAWFTAVSAGLDSGVAHAVEFGPIVSWSAGPVALVLNPFLEKTFGDDREDGIAFAYGWRATYEIAERLNVGIEGYGEIENIADAPPGAEQIHRLGPVLYLGHVHGNPAHARLHADIHAPGHDDAAHGSGYAHRAQSDGEWHAEIGVLFGLTRETPDAALKFNVGIDF